MKTIVEAKDGIVQRVRFEPETEEEKARAAEKAAARAAKGAAGSGTVPLTLSHGGGNSAHAKRK